MTERESIKFRQLLRRVRWMFFIVVGVVFGLIMFIKECNETRERKASIKAFKTKLESMVNNPSLFDFYEFQTRGLEAKYGKYSGHGRPFGKIIKLEGDQVWFRLSNKPNLFFSDNDDIVKLAFFEDEKSDLDTISLSKSALLATLHRDTLTIKQRDTAYQIIELLNIERLDGPDILPAGGNFQGQNLYSYTFYNDSFDGVITAIEPKTGTAISEKSLPFELSRGRDNRFRVSGTLDNIDAEFYIIATSKRTARLVFKVKIETRKVTVERVY